MKRILLGLSLALCGFCNADTVAYMKNNAGGVIVLTDVKCDKNSFIVYGNTKDGTTITGCWFLDDNFVFVKWSSGDLKTYPFTAWTFKQKSYE